MEDLSNGWNAVADAFAAARSEAGADVVRAWAAQLPPGGRVVDVGAGTGWPITQALIDAGLDVRAVEPAPAMTAKLRARFPDVRVDVSPAQTSPVLDQTHTGVVAIGLVFLLGADAQTALIARLAGAVAPGGHLLISAPRQCGTWNDLQTGRRSVSLGANAYGAILRSCGLTEVHQIGTDSGTTYYDARRPRLTNRCPSPG